MSEYKKGEQIYEGKAKKVFATDDPDYLIVEYKDSATAFDGLKKGTILGKGVVNNRMSNMLMDKLSKEAGIPTHFVEEISDRETVVKNVKILPLECIVRNISAGSFAKRYGVEEGIVFAEPSFETSYKNDELHDPLMVEDHAIALGLSTREEYEKVREMALAVDKYLQKFFLGIGLKLVDFKLEFGKFHDEIILADEISPDTCRLWDVETNEKMDKDRFRRDLGNVEETYQEVFRRVTEACK
ncbi:MAG: phosphoribosylaminoimidazolesuccinocarboxamide synthase [Anaerovoracaceae bacterium]|jgi:phosphoribosylaminoimidazole-succinocarboxamide synthase